MNKQEVFEKVKELKGCTTFVPENRWIRRDEVLNIIDQLDEPKKPLIPLFVANWLDDCKNNKVSLVDSMNTTFMKTKNQSKETIEWISCNQEEFALAWAYDYVIEEKRYTAKFKKTGEYLRLW